MKTISINCDICGKQIDYKEEKYYTFEAPGVIDLKENAVRRYEVHICKDHDYTSVMLQHSKYELDMLKELNELLRNNRFKPVG